MKRLPPALEALRNAPVVDEQLSPEEFQAIEEFEKNKQVSSLNRRVGFDYLESIPEDMTLKGIPFRFAHGVLSNFYWSTGEDPDEGDIINLFLVKGRWYSSIYGSWTTYDCPSYAEAIKAIEGELDV